MGLYVLLMCVRIAAAKGYSCTFIVLDIYSDLESNKSGPVYQLSL